MTGGLILRTVLDMLDRYLEQHGDRFASELRATVARFRRHADQA